VAGSIVALSRGVRAAALGWREFAITYRIAPQDKTVPARFWVPVPQDALDYRRIVDPSWNTEPRILAGSIERGATSEVAHLENSSTPIGNTLRLD
jgi:hypothetical protein